MHPKLSCLSCQLKQSELAFTDSQMRKGIDFQQQQQTSGKPQ